METFRCLMPRSSLCPSLLQCEGMKQPGCLPEGQSHSGSVFAAALWCLCGETPCLMSTLINFVNDRSMWACRMLRRLKITAHLPFWVRTGLGFTLNKHTIKPETEENVPSRWHPFQKKSKEDMALLNSTHIFLWLSGHRQQPCLFTSCRSHLMTRRLWILHVYAPKRQPNRCSWAKSLICESISDLFIRQWPILSRSGTFKVIF